MSVVQAETQEGPERGGAARPRSLLWRRRVGLGLAAVVLAGGGAVWLNRERIAADMLDRYLAERKVPATYRIVSIAPDRQVIENLVIGDPARPDLTVRRMVIETGLGWSGPAVRRVSLDGVRVFASYRAGRVSLGALDPLVFTGAAAQPALPAIEVALTDARGLLESDYGRIGVALAGMGRLDDGFAGTFAATAPGISSRDCRAGRATLYGRLTTSGGAPALDGPLRLADLACAGGRLAQADIGTRLHLAPGFARARADFKLTGGGAALAGVSAARLEGMARLDWAEGRLALGHDLALTGIASLQGRMARLAAQGSWRGAADGASGQWEGRVTGFGLAPGPGFDRSLAETENAMEGMLLAPLLGKARVSLARALEGSSLRAEAVIRHKGSAATLTIPEAGLVTRSGERVLALLRAGVNIGAGGVTGLGGNILAGGEGLPSLNGRIDQSAGGGWTVRLTMADYAAGANRLAVPRLAIKGNNAGDLTFEGLVTASGTLPGGGVSALTFPLEGRFAPGRGLAIGTRCTPVKFASLKLSGLALGTRAITLCPEGGAPILAYRDALRLAARTGALSLAGKLGESPATLAASGGTLRYPQPFSIENLAATIGTGKNEVRLAAASLTGRLSQTVSGQITGGTARLAAVPFDLDRVTAGWAYKDGVLALTDGGFILSDRPAEGAAVRFVPLAANNARLSLVDNRITADALLRHPGSQRAVVEVAVTHDLETAKGGARLAVPGLVFDKGLQPDALSPLAKGVIALARGTITGTGRIDWQGEDITSSGTFATRDFDVAATFGPVRGVAGKVTFTDLLNLTTAPDQTLSVAAINPGVEVLAGHVTFDLSDGTRLSVKDARFPFMGGMLQMRPLAMDINAEEERRYVFEITGLDAAKFVAQMELGNISATGIFDGIVPIVFDEHGNGRIEGGLLIARAGGGNVSYLGELAYEDLGAMGNYAFAALRSLDYRQMRVSLDGALAGEIITSFSFDGVRQGEGASRNFVTRQLAQLPIQFNINVRSQSFTQLAIIVRGYSDPTAWGNPFDRGLLSIENGRIIKGQGQGGPPVSVTPVTVKTGGGTAVQPPASKDRP
jgi:hypothetical protein